jgi:hypothetical protein
MGSTTFLLPRNLTPAAIGLLERACFAGGYDQTPVPTLSEVEADRLYVSRAMSESGFLLVPWTVEPFGTLITTTSTLRDRAEPYVLVVELARGKLNQVRAQTAEWHLVGLQTTEPYDQELAEVTKLFGQAVLNDSSDHVNALGLQVLERCYRLSDQLVRSYVEQMLATRTHASGPLDTRFAARFHQVHGDSIPPEYSQSFNAARIGIRWADVEPVESEYLWDSLDDVIQAAGADGLPITAGPIIDLTSGMLPAWAAGWSGDLPALAAFMCDYLETVISRYRGTLRRWVVCSGFNHSDGLGLSDDDRLRLAARLFEAAQALDPNLELVLGIVQPWGDYLVHDDQTISPLAFADDLIRSGVRISSVELELQYGTTPRGSWPRDLLDTSRLLELFAVLGLPLEVLLGYPADPTIPYSVTEHAETLNGPMWHSPPTAASQAAWGASVAALCLCKPHVRAVTWEQWSDRDTPVTASGGLLNSQGQARPLLARFRAIRSEYLR